MVGYFLFMQLGVDMQIDGEMLQCDTNGTHRSCGTGTQVCLSSL